MNGIRARVIREGSGPNLCVPLSIALVDLCEVRRAGVAVRKAVCAIAAEIAGPVAINVFDQEALTTTSDGLMVSGAIVAMAAGDMGKVNAEFGFLEMKDVQFSEELVRLEPHLAQWRRLGTERSLYRGPDPAHKLIPVHNAVLTGRAVNNNSASEMMNVVTMQEILFPILGQLQVMADGPVLIGPTGEHISVGIGMTVAEECGRIFPTRQFRAGDTAHGSGEYAKTLKAHIPCIAAPKDVLARHIVRALSHGMVPGLQLGCSPAVLSVAQAVGVPIAWERVTQNALGELASVGITESRLREETPRLSSDEAIRRADEVIPGMDRAVRLEAHSLAEEVLAPLV